MTKNQIEYQKLQETMRANRANESITSTRDQATRRLGLDTLQETARHNQQVELQARDNLAETYRNNLAQLQELQRSHLASEGIAREQTLNQRYLEAETQRHNVASEQEVARHNKIQEDLSLYSSDISELAARLSAESHVNAAGISAAASQYASDISLLAKQLQVDLDKYGIDTNKELRTNELRESRRAAIARQNEINRSNRVNEGLQSGSLLESVRKNLVDQAQNRAKLNADVNLRGEQNRINAMNAETQRKSVDMNIDLAPSQKFSNYSRGISSLVGAATTLTNAFKKGGK